jgi:hypothetical protein
MAFSERPRLKRIIHGSGDGFRPFSSEQEALAGRQVATERPHAQFPGHCEETLWKYIAPDDVRFGLRKERTSSIDQALKEITAHNFSIGIERCQSQISAAFKF